MAKRTSLLTGQAIMRAGERDPVRRAALHDRRLRVRQEELWHSRCGNGKEEAWFELQQVVETYDFCGPPYLPVKLENVMFPVRWSSAG